MTYHCRSSTVVFLQKYGGREAVDDTISTIDGGSTPVTTSIVCIHAISIGSVERGGETEGMIANSERGDRGRGIGGGAKGKEVCQWEVVGHVRRG